MHVEESIRIARPPTEVWDAIADYSFDLQWRDGLSEMTPDPPGPAALGTKVREVVRSSGRDYVADTIVTELDPGRSYRFEGKGTIGTLRGGRRVEPDGENAAVFSYEIEIDPAGMSRLLSPLLGRIVGSNLRKDLARLREQLEA